MTIALVFGPIAASIFSTDESYVPNSTSTKTGTNLFCNIGLTVVGKPAAAVITSSPSFRALFPNREDVRAVTARRFAEEPELHNIACFMPITFANFFSNSSA